LTNPYIAETTSLHARHPRRADRRRHSTTAATAAPPKRADVIGSGTDWIWFSGILCDVANAAATA
jgi:hypothetical protein